MYLFIEKMRVHKNFGGFWWSKYYLIIYCNNNVKYYIIFCMVIQSTAEL